MIVGFDLETTGLEHADGHRIMEVAAVVFDLAGVEKGSFVQRYNPQRPVDPKAQAVHGISFEDVSLAPLFSRDAAKIHQLLSRCKVIVAHNGVGFDMPFVNSEFTRAGLAPVGTPCLDTMLDGRWATPWGKLPNLGELAFACGVGYDPEQAHGALYDVRVMMQSFFRARGMGFFPCDAIDHLPLPIAA